MLKKIFPLAVYQAVYLAEFICAHRFLLWTLYFFPTQSTHRQMSIWSEVLCRACHTTLYPPATHKTYLGSERHPTQSNHHCRERSRLLHAHHHFPQDTSSSSCEHKGRQGTTPLTELTGCPGPPQPLFNSNLAQSHDLVCGRLGPRVKPAH